MDKFKVNGKVVSLLLIIGLFAGWEYMLLASAFALVFCSKDKEVMNNLVKVLVLLAACALFSKSWNLITAGYDLIIEALKGIFSILGYINPLITFPTWLNNFLLGPIQVVIDWISSAVVFLILLVEINYIYTTIVGKSIAKPFKIIDDYMTKFSNFVLDKVTTESPKASSKNEKICPECGNHTTLDAKFCTKCGSKFKEEGNE